MYRLFFLFGFPRSDVQIGRLSFTAVSFHKE